MITRRRARQTTSRAIASVACRDRLLLPSSPESINLVDAADRTRPRSSEARARTVPSHGNVRTVTFARYNRPFGRPRPSNARTIGQGRPTLADGGLSSNNATPGPTQPELLPMRVTCYSRLQEPRTRWTKAPRHRRRARRRGWVAYVLLPPPSQDAGKSRSSKLFPGYGQSIHNITSSVLYADWLSMPRRKYPDTCPVRTAAGKIARSSKSSHDTVQPSMISTGEQGVHDIVERRMIPPNTGQRHRASPLPRYSGRAWGWTRAPAAEPSPARGHPAPSRPPEARTSPPPADPRTTTPPSAGPASRAEQANKHPALTPGRVSMRAGAATVSRDRVSAGTVEGLQDLLRMRLTMLPFSAARLRALENAKTAVMGVSDPSCVSA